MTLTTSWAKIRATFRWQFRRGLGVSAAYWIGFLLICLIPERFIHMLPVSEKLILLCLWITGFAFLLSGFYLGSCFSRKQADMVHAMPIPRGSFYLGSMLTGAAVICAPVIPGLIIREISTGDRQYLTVLQTSVVLLILGASTLIFFGLMAAATGSYVEYFLVSLFLSWAPVLTILGGANLMQRTIPGTYFLYRLGPWLTIVSPPVSLFSLGSEPTPLLALAVLVCALYCWAGWAWYRRRPSEMAGHPLKCRWLEWLLRGQMGVLAAVMLGYWSTCLAYDYQWSDLGIPLTLGIMALGLIGSWAVMELIYRKSLRGLLRHFIPEAVSLGLTVALLAATSTGLGLDTAVPAEGDIYAAAVSGSVEYMNIYLDDVVVYEPGSEDSLFLHPALYSPELMGKILELNQKWIQMERASQYPYLPGRNAYSQGQAICFHFFTMGGGVFWDSVNYHYNSRPTPESQALMEECQALLLEINSSDERVEGLIPLCALDALTAVAHEPVSWPKRFTDFPAKAAKPVESFPDGFMEELEAALREDFSNGFCTVMDDINSEEDIFQLRYSTDTRFVAKGGSILSSLYGHQAAKGKELALQSPYDSKSWLVFGVSPRMKSTYALLKRCYYS